MQTGSLENMNITRVVYSLATYENTDAAYSQGNAQCPPMFPPCWRRRRFPYVRGIPVHAVEEQEEGDGKEEERN
jgi:hypothetical protein